MHQYSSIFWIVYRQPNFLQVTGDGSETTEGQGGLQTVALDLNQHTTEATIAQDGSIIITGVDGSQIPVSVSGAYCASSLSGMLSVPLPLYQTVVANIHASEGHPLHVVTPVMQVPKLEPGLDGGGLSNVEVATLNPSLEGSIITAAQHSMDEDEEEQHTHTVELVQHKGHN